MAIPKPTTSPAFQFYPRDFLSSPKVARMSLTEIGIYIKLLSHCWLNNGLPAEVGKLAGMVGMKPKQFERIWTNVLCECFYERGGRLLNERLDEERKKQADYKRRQSDRASVRWENRRVTHAAALQGPASSGINPALPPQCSSSSSSSSSSSTQIPTVSEMKSAEPQGDSSPVVLSFPTIGAGLKTWDLRERQVQSWLSAYPHLDIRGESRKALAWLDAHPEKRKTAVGMPRFLVGWFNRAVERGGAGPPLPMAVGQSLKTAGNLAAITRFVNRGGGDD